MLLSPVKTYIENRRLKKIADTVRNGKVPIGVDQQTIFKALRQTKPPGVVEMFGFLKARLERSNGELVFDERLVSVNKVTEDFTQRLVDALTDSSVTMAGFNQHKMGAGSTAETNSQSALITQQVGAQGATGGAAQTHGSSSSIYQSVGTLTAGSAYGCREHGIFNSSTGGVMLDRSVVTNIDLNTDDIVTWTYSLTATPEA